MRIGINGFGRIGRTLTRVLFRRARHELVHVNDLLADSENLAYLLRHDSNYGRFPARVEAQDGSLRVGGDEDRWQVGLTSRRDTGEVNWQDRGVEVLVESTGAETNERGAAGLVGGELRHVVITQASQWAEVTLVRGANDDRVDPRRHAVVSSSTCDASAIAPVFRLMADAFGVRCGAVTTLHPWLAYQNLLDGPLRSVAMPGRYKDDYRLGRAAPGALIPKPTTAGQAVEEVVPCVRGLIVSGSYRVPTVAVCYADLVLWLGRHAARDEIVRALATGEPWVQATQEALISTDLVGLEASALVDLRCLQTGPDAMVRMTLGYDNEWGYACRLHDLLDDLAEAS
jgi:glyceraldehyde 3-phosphate dehydrogenase